MLQKRKIEPRANIQRCLGSFSSKLVDLNSRRFRTTAENSLIGEFSSSLKIKMQQYANRYFYDNGLKKIFFEKDVEQHIS